MTSIWRSICLVVTAAAVFLGATAPDAAAATTLQVASICAYDGVSHGASRAPNAPHTDGHHAAPPVLHGAAVRLHLSRAQGPTLAASRPIATEAADDLVRFDPEFASHQIAGQNLPGSAGCATTPGGSTLSVHAAERTLIGGPGRSPIDPALIDDILQQSTRTAYRGLNDTVKVSAPNLCGKCCVVLDAQTGKHVVTVMVPK
mgnify:CR=1 FL=1